MTASSNLARASQTGVPDGATAFGAEAETAGAVGRNQYQKAQEHFVLREYEQASTALEKLLGLRPDPESAPYLHGTAAAKLLLARAYYHSARLGRAEEMAREVLGEDPMDAYAALLLGRSLQRQGRKAEAEPALRLAKALGAPDLDD